MRKNRRRWTDLEVKRWAKCYTSRPRITLMFLENYIGVAHSTLWWCFTHRLQAIDSELYIKAMERLQENKHISA